MGLGLLGREVGMEGEVDMTNAKDQSHWITREMKGQRELRMPRPHRPLKQVLNRKICLNVWALRWKMESSVETLDMYWNNLFGEVASNIATF